MKHLLVPQLKKLVSIDTSIRSLMQQIENTTKDIDQVKKALNGIAEQIELLHQEKESAKKKVNEQELESQNLRDQEVHAREQLATVRSHKEYELTNKELSHITEKRLLLDDVIIKVWHDLEKAEKHLATELPAYLTKKEQLTAENIEKEQKLVTLTQQLDALEKERVEASQAVPEEWLTKYTRMRLRVNDPIVPLASTHCSSCFYGIPRQEITNLKRDFLIICRSCYRFIYQPDETTEKKLDTTETETLQ